ncbi:hypothetical protein BC332_26990 [Capsicum chinense]|nr:hypothetical protein BC332_26990 [Capsicum chinense]
MTYAIEVQDDRCQLYNVLTTVTSDADKVTAWINEIEYVHRRRLNRLIVGLDIEWRPNSGSNQQNPVATLQLCVGRRCLIFQLLYCQYIPYALTEFLSNPRYAFAGVGEVGGNAGLKTLCGVVLGREMEKPGHVTMGRWDNEWLDMAQVQYACVDAFVSFEIGKCLNASGY